MKASQAPGLNPGPPVAGAGALVTLNEQVKRVSMDNARKSRDYDEGPDREFVMSHGLSTAEAGDLWRKWGRNELVEEDRSRWRIIFRQVLI